MIEKLKNKKNFIDLATSNPELAKEWHPTKNKNITPSDISYRSGKIFWWVCDQGHEWTAKVSTRVDGHGCPYCAGWKVLPGYNDLESSYPQLVAEWHPTKNGDLLPSEVSNKSLKEVWWICNRGHEWKEKIYIRAKGRDCPYCSGQKVLPGFNDLKTKNPELVKMWDYERNCNLKPETLQESEVDEVGWFDLEEVWTEIQTSRERFCMPTQGMNVLREYLNSLQK